MENEGHSFRSILRNDYAILGVLAFLLPVIAAFTIVGLIQLLVVNGIVLPGPISEPVFGVWIVFVGTLIAVCLLMKQFFILFIAGLLSFCGTVLIWVMYVL